MNHTVQTAVGVIDIVDDRAQRMVVDYVDHAVIDTRAEPPHRIKILADFALPDQRGVSLLDGSGRTRLPEAARLGQ